MGDGAVDLSSPKSLEIYGPPPPPPPKDEGKAEGKEAKAAPPPPPSGQELQKLTADVKSLGIKLPAELLDEKGNLKPDQLEAAKKILTDQAEARRKSDLGASARLLQKAVSLDPKDGNLRLEASQRWVEWSEKQKDKGVKQATLERAFEFIKDVEADPQKDPVMATAKFNLAKKLCALHVGTTRDFEKATGYLKLAVRSGTSDDLKQLLEDLKANPHPELYGKYDNPYEFFSHELVDVDRFEDAKGVYDTAARDFSETDPEKSAYFKKLSGIVADSMDPKPDYDKFTAWDPGFQKVMDLELDETGHYKSAFAGDARARVKSEAEAFLKTDAMKGLRPGSEEYNRRLTAFLGRETEYHLLPQQDKTELLNSGFTVTFEGKTEQIPVQVEKFSDWRINIQSSPDQRKALFLKRQGDYWMSQNHPTAAIAHFKKSLELNPDDTMARVGLARAQTAMGQLAGNKRLKQYCFDSAAKNLGNAAEGDPNKWQVLHATGDLLLATGHPKEALGFLHEALDLAKATGVPEYALNDKLLMHGTGGSLVALNDTPLGKSLQRAQKEAGEKVAKDRLIPEDMAPREKLMQDLMLKGVKVSDVVAWYNKTYTVLQVTEATVTPDTFLEYALKHLDQHRGDLEKIYGKLPLDSKGNLDPEVKKSAQDYLDDRKKKAETAAQKQGLKPDTPEFKEAVDKMLAQKDDLAEAYTALLAPPDTSNPANDFANRAVAFNKVQGILLDGYAQQAKESGKVGEAFKYYQMAGEALRRTYDLTGEQRFSRASAKSFYQAAYIARQGGDEATARQLFMKGGSVLQTGGEKLLQDPQAMKLLGDGLMEIGKYKEAKGYYDMAQTPLPQYLGAFEEPPPGFMDQLKLSSSYCNRMADTEEKLGVDFFDRKLELEEKQAQGGKLTAEEKTELDRMQKGYTALKKLSGLQLPPSADANEIPGIRNLRDALIEAIKSGDAAKTDELLAKAQRQVQNAETLQMADSLRKKTLLPQLPPQVQDYIKRTNDWSVLKTGYGEGDRLPEDWNAEQLNNMPVLKALREWDEKNPEQAKQIRDALAAFRNPRIVPGGEAMTDLDKLNAEVDKVEALLFKTDPKTGKLPTDPKTGARIFEPTETFGAWFQDATELELRDKPEAWIQHNLNDYRQSLGAIGKTMASLEGIRTDYTDTKKKLADAKQSGNTAQAAFLQQHLDDLNKQIAELRGNFGQAFQAQAKEFNSDLETFGTHSRKLGKVGQGGKYAYQDQLSGAQGKLKSAGDRLEALGADADPEKVLDEMISGSKDLAGAQALLLKGITLVHTANLQGFNPGHMETDVSDFGGEDMKYHPTKPAQVKTWWEDDPKWTSAMAALDKQFDPAAAMDAPAIEKYLGANLDHLKATDQAMFKDLPTTVKEGISSQLIQLGKMRQAKLDAGEDVREYDTLIEKYHEAEKALNGGDVDKALALFRIATESKRQSRVGKDFEDFQDSQKWKTLLLEVAIITAAAAATAVTMGALAPVAGAAAAAGTAAIATEVGLVLLEGAVFVTYEMTLRSALFAAKEGFGIKNAAFANMEDPWRDIHGIGDFGWKIVTNAAMLKALKVVGEAYQVVTLSERVLAKAGTTALLEDAAAVGMRRTMMRELLNREMAELSLGGKALYNLGAFGAEAAGMQAWSNAQIGLDMLYQRVAHGKKLEWKQFSAAVDQANSTEQIEHGIAMLVGLKLGGLATHPIIGRFQSSEQVSASQKIKLDLFLKTKSSFETRLQTAMEKAAAEGKPFQMDAALRGEAARLRELGAEAMDVGSQLEKSKGLRVFTEDEKASWKESNDWLGKWIEYSGKEEKLNKGTKAAPAPADKKESQGAKPKVEGQPKAGPDAKDDVQAAKQKQEAQWKEAFGKGVSIEEVKRGGEILGYRVKGAEGETADLFLKDKTKGELWATPEQYKAYRAFQTAERTKAAEAKAKADAEAKLVEGFGKGQKIILNADTGKYELQNAEGKTLRIATDAEQKLYSDYQTKEKAHEEVVEKRAQALAPEFEKGTVIRPQIKKADTYQEGKVDDDNVRAVQDSKGQVHYLAKVTPEGTRVKPTEKEAKDFLAGKAPKDEVVGYEKVVDGKVVDGPIAKDDFEAYQHWAAQQKEAAKVVVLKAVEAPAVEASDPDKTSVAVPKKQAGAPDPQARLAADAAKAFDLSYDHALQSGKAPKAEDLTKEVRTTLEAMAALGPALDGLPKGKRQAVHDGLLQALAEGKMTKEQALELADKVKKGEAVLVPDAKAEFGFKIKTQAAPKPGDGETTLSDVSGERDAKGKGAKGKATAGPAADSDLVEGVRRINEAQSDLAPWQKAIDQAERFGTPKDQAAAKQVREAAGRLKDRTRDYLQAKAEVKKYPEGSPERQAAEKRLGEVQGQLRKDLDLIQKWEDYPKARSEFLSQVGKTAAPFLERSIQAKGFEKGFLTEGPEGPQILDVSIRQPGYGDDFQTGPGKTQGDYQVVLHVRSEADADALLRDVRLNHGENKAQFVKDADGKVRSVEMTTPDGKVFSVRVELATPENRANSIERGGIVGGSHEGIGYKDHNEDRQVVVAFANGRTVTLVIDGMGGTEGGEMAAKIAQKTFEQAVQKGKSVEVAIHLANEAVSEYGKELLPGLTKKFMDQGYDKDVAEAYAKRLLPGAVAMGTEVSRNADGSYNARFRSVGDCEAAVIRFKPDGQVEILDAYGRSEDQIKASRSNPHSNLVDQALGGHAGPIRIQSKDVTVQKGDLILSGSDGFFENFGSHSEIAFLIQQSGAQTPAEIRTVLMREVLIRQKLADTLEKSGKDNMVLTKESYAEAYRTVTGQEPPADFKGLWEGKVLDKMGNVGDAKDLGTVRVDYADGTSIEFQGVPRDKMKSHFNKDNTTLVVQGVGEPIIGNKPAPSRAELAKEQMELAKELAGSVGMDQNADFMKDLNALVLKDIGLAGRDMDPTSRRDLISQRSKEARALAERYGLEKNPAFLKLLGRLVVDNLREGEIRFGEPGAKAPASDPKLQSFMEKQRGYGLKLVSGFEGKVDPAKRLKFTADVGKLLSEDAAGLPSGGDPALEAKFKADREKAVEALAKEYGLDGDPKFLKAAKMLLVDRVLKDCPRVEVPPPKVDPAVVKASRSLEVDVYNQALLLGRNREEAAQLADAARVSFDKAIQEGKKPDQAKASAYDEALGTLKEQQAPFGPDKATVPPPRGRGGAEPANTPSGVRVAEDKGEQNAAELQLEVDHLAKGDTPFAPAAKEFKEGKITPTEYRARQKAVAEKMVEDHKAAFDDVMGFLKELGADPDLHLSSEFPPKGRMKAAGDLAPKLVRRGWQDTAPLTDVAGTRIIVRSNADVEAVIARLQQKYKIREAYTKEGEIDTEVMGPADMKAKGLVEEEGVVWIDAKLDQDGIHRLVEGHPASGYRALHVVVEVDGKPVEIQIKTEAMHEWGELEHKLVYKNKDLPAATLDPIKQFTKASADYLAKVTHLEPGEKAPEPPKAPELPADTPNRAEIQAGLDQMSALLQKYSSGDRAPDNVVQIPKAPKAFDGDALTRKASYEVDLYERLFPDPVGRPGIRNTDLTSELEVIRERLAESGNQALLDKFDADFKALRTAPQDSAEYRGAVERLGDVLDLNHGDARFRQPVFFMDDAKFNEFAQASKEIYDKSQAPVPSVRDGKGADVIPLRPKAKSEGDAPLKLAAETDPEGLRSRLDAKGADPKQVLEPLAGVEKALEATKPELSAKLKADRETLLKGEKDSPEYEAAMQRLVLLDAALRGPLEYGKGMKPEALESFVRPLYEEPPPSSKGPSSGATGTFATGTGVVLGILALLAPETARAAEGPLQQIQQSLHVGPVEALMILGIGTLIGLPMVRKFWSGPKGPGEPPPASRDNPVRVEQDGKTLTVRPFEKRDLQSGRVIEGTVGTFSKGDSIVVGDTVHLGLETFDPASGNKKSTQFLMVSKEEAKRLGVKFNKAGDEIAELPKTEFLVKETDNRPEPKLPVAADAAPKDKPVAVVKDPQGQETEVKDLSVADSAKGSGALRSFGKATSVEVSKDNPKQVTVRVDVYDPADPNADPTSLAFGIGKPEVVEQRSFTMSREEAQRFGLPLGEPGVSVQVTEQKLLVLNDKASDVGVGNALYIPTSNEGGQLIYPAHTIGKKAISGKIVTVDADRTSVLGDTVYVFFRTPDMPGMKGKALGADPIPMTLAEARKLGIALGYGGKLRVEKNQFILSEVQKGKGKDVLVDGKPFEGEDAPVSVRFKVGDDGKIHLTGTDGKDLEAPKVEAGMVTGEGAQGVKIPDAVKVLGPTAAGILLLLSPNMAEAATQFGDQLATGGIGLAVAAGIGTLLGLPFIYRGGGGGKPPVANHPPFQMAPGCESFEVMADAAGRPVVNQYMGQVTPPLLTFQRGPQGQWYAFEGKPPKNVYESMQDPVLSKMWRPVKDGDLYKIGDFVLPFKTPADAKITYVDAQGNYVDGYASPPNLGVNPNVPPPVAVSGKLPVGELRTIVPKGDGTPFVIGRGQGDLQFTDAAVSSVHATILKNPADGKWYLVDGPVGDTTKVSTNGVWVQGGRMPKYYALRDGESFVINGATFQFRAPPEPPPQAAPAPAAQVIPLNLLKLQRSPEGFPIVQASNGPYAVRYWQKGWTNLGEMTLGRVVSASKVPNDPQGKVRLEVRTTQGTNPQEGAITLEMTPAEAAELRIPLRADGSLDPQAAPLIRFDAYKPAAEGRLAADNPNAVYPNQVPVARPAPPPPPVRVEVKGGDGKNYQLKPQKDGAPLEPGQSLARITMLEPLPGQSGGKLWMETELLGPDFNPVKKVRFSITREEAAGLGLKVRADGRLAADSPQDIRYTPSALQDKPGPAVQVKTGPVDVELDGRNVTLTPASPDILWAQKEIQRVNSWVAKVKDVKPTTPGDPTEVTVTLVYVKTGYGDTYETSVSMNVADAQRLGIPIDAKGRYVPDGQPRYFKLKSFGPVNMPKYNLDGPLPKGVKAVIQDNGKDAPRRGRVDADAPTVTYGTAAGETHEGVGYKSKNEDAVVQGPNWAAVIDGMGGHGHGDKASEIAGKALAHYLDAHRNDPDPKKTLHDALVYAGDAVNASPEGKGGGGAVAVVHMVVTNLDGSQKVLIGHVGDAGALVVGKDGKIKYQTADHGPAGLQMEEDIKWGEDRDKAETDKRANPDANIVVNCLGAGHEVDPVVREFPLEEGDRVVMYSDGLGDAMSSVEIARRAIQAGSAKEAEADLFRTGLHNMEDFNDALAELKPGKRLPVTREAFVDAQGNIYDRPEGGKVLGKVGADFPGWDRFEKGGYLDAQGDVYDSAQGGKLLGKVGDKDSAWDYDQAKYGAVPPGERRPVFKRTTEDYRNIPPGERRPIQKQFFIDRKGDIYDAPAEGKLVDHYKKDNLTVHVYFHNPKSPYGGGSGAKGPSQPPPVSGKSKSQINFQSIPQGNRVGESELKSLEALDKRPHVAKILSDPDLQPVTKVTAGGQTFYLSRVIESVDERGEVRPHVLALVPVQEGGKTVLKRRFFYKSNSDGGWRASPYQIGGHIAKGVGRHYTQETQPIPELNEAFQFLEDAGSGFPKLRMKDEDFANYIDVGSPLLDQGAQQTMLAGFGKEVFFPSNVGMTDIGGLQPGKAFKGGGYYGASDPAIVPKLASLRYPDGFIPDFSKGPSKVYQETHTLLGPITCREFSGGFLVEKGTGRKRPVVWTMAEDGQGRTWVKSIRYTDSKVNSYGVYDEVIDSGIITSKPLEYAKQSYKLPEEYRPDFNGEYVDITPALNMLKPIRQYRESRGLANLELPKGGVAPSPPPPPGGVRVVVSKPLPGPNGDGAAPPPVNGVPVQSALVPGLTGTQGKWVYQMPPDLTQVILGREAFMGQEEGKSISGKHIRIYRADGTTFIQDSMSLNGTQVIRDGKVAWASRGKADPIPSIFPLRPGDRIVMGKVEIEFNPASN
ncbi:MAG: protein phosphatase 2C domain-containing protein [bacterium]